MKRILHDRMTKADLMELLQDVPDEAIIAFEIPSNDHWGNVIAKTFDAHSCSIDPVEISWSDYHDNWTIDEGDDDDESVGLETEKQTVFVIS